MAILTVCLCAVAGCRGSAAQEPYDGVLARAQRPEKVDVQPTPPPEAEPIASEVDAPWTIALLSNAKTRPVKRTRKSIVVDTPSTAFEQTDRQIDVVFATDGRAAEAKTGTGGPTGSSSTPKTCNGVVNRRS